jgi:hypothetical protein
MKQNIILLIIHLILTILMVFHISYEADRIKDITDDYLNHIWIDGCHYGIIKNKCE